ncbi:YciI family protein [Streptacidiphilus neutrinimicus]|uniref:YciI family protein n=1 Tax=Streptacidiphilus neutrinimicus TaxID=105420 RepID=UPI0005A89477|nr:YciI family protein [Streptacidiphilus neutrinimicus]
MKKQYLLSMYQPQGPIPDADFLAKVMAELGAIRTELQSAGDWVFGQGLHDPSTATVLRPKDGEVLITDGPFTEGKEYLGGFTIIKAADLDAALAWGGRYAQATGLPIEVRPFQGEVED